MIQKSKFLLTSRPYGRIVSEFLELVSAFPYVHIPGKTESNQIGLEVNHVIEYRVPLLARRINLNNDLEDHLRRQLLKVYNRTYLWVYLVFDHLEQPFKKTKKSINDLIDTLPENVEQAYDRILSRSKHPHKARIALSIILAAAQPLTLAEMNIAVNMGLTPEAKCVEDLDLESEDSFKGTLRAWCGLFISIYHDQVYFLHQTAREFLLPKPPASASSAPSGLLQWCGSISLEQAHSITTDICLRYLDFRDVQHNIGNSQLSPDFIHRRQVDIPQFFRYSAIN